MNNCEIIRDLLPLYADEVCSDASRELVDDHLADCGDCRAALESIRADIIPAAAEKKAVGSFADGLHRVWHKKAVRVAVISALAAALVLIGGFCALTLPEFTVPYDAQATTVSEPEDGGVDVHIDLKYSRSCAAIIDNDDGTVDVYMTVLCNPLTALLPDDDVSYGERLVRFGNDMVVSYEEGSLLGHVKTTEVAHIYYVFTDKTGRRLYSGGAEGLEQIEDRVLIWSREE